MKLFAEYNRLNLTVIVAVLLLAGVVYYVLLNHMLIHELDEDLMEKRRKIEAYAAKHAALPAFEDLDDVQVFYAQVPSPIEESLPAFVGRYDPEKANVHRYRQLVYTHVFAGKYYQVTIFKPVEGAQALLRVIAGITFTAMLLIIGLSVLISRIVLRKLWQPFYETLEALPSWTLGKKQPPSFPETDVDEFIFLKDRLNATISRVQQEHRSLLLLTNIEQQQFLSVSPVNVKEKIEEKAQQLQPLWHHHNLKVTTQLQPVTISMNPELMDILLNHLLNNATRHNIPGGALCITLTPGCLTLENSGSEKPLDDTRLFRRFYKEEQHNQNHGVGLSIIREICTQAGITLKYSFAEQRHVFSLMFP